jgi:AcrR family transcriptional regulator
MASRDHDRTDRILDAAVALAEQDGYEAVRLRDLAERAEVALGTVYRRFAGKEDILAAVLEREVSRLHEGLRHGGIAGATADERLNGFFAVATHALAARPKLAAAMLRAVASGDPALSGKITRYYDRMVDILVLVARGAPDGGPPTDEEALLARMLQNVWFGALVGWTGGLHDPDEVVRLVRAATQVVLAGLGAAGR